MLSLCFRPPVNTLRLPPYSEHKNKANPGQFEESKIDTREDLRPKQTAGTIKTQASGIVND